MIKKLDGGKTKAENIVKVIVEKVKEPKVKLVKVIVEKPKITAKVFTKVVQDALEGKPKMDLNGLVKRATARGNGTVMDISQPKVKKDDRQATRLAFIRQNSATILKAWDALKGKKSGAALNRVLPGMHNKWIDEVLMLAGLRQSGEEVVIKAVAADKPLLKDVVVVKKAANASKPKALVAREAKEAASVARFNASDAELRKRVANTEKANNKAKVPVVKDGGYTDEG